MYGHLQSDFCQAPLHASGFIIYIEYLLDDMLGEPGHARSFLGTLIRGLVGGKVLTGNVDPNVPFFEVGLYLLKVARPWMAFIGHPEIEPGCRI